MSYTTILTRHVIASVATCASAKGRSKVRLVVGACIAFVALVQTGAQSLSREYIRLGSRVIAIEGPALQASLSPAAVNVTAWQPPVTFTATVTGASNTSVTWNNPTPGQLVPATDGSSTAVYHPPQPISSTQAITVQATSVVDATATATATINLQPVTVSVSPSGSLSMTSGTSQTFTANVTGDAGAPSTGVSWNLNGTVVQNGGSTYTYTAPNAATTATLTVTSNADTFKFAIVNITVNQATTSTLALNPTNATVGPGAAHGGGCPAYS